ncbi:hypothetical protein TcYC6_0003770 [Trypanosoma cruzi]|nr:hypothetical protein TcYC6_0003770 [Trypanosoma cruzi]
MLQTQPGSCKKMALVPYTSSEWCGIGARLWDLVRQDGDTQVQIKFIYETHVSEETLTVAASTTDLCPWLSRPPQRGARV